jgi:two-component system chemotaxis sensor kinase CheA
MELSQDMLRELRAESSELIERFSSVWILMNSVLEKGQAVGRTEVDELFRILHTLKGLAEIARLSRVVSALHLVEDRLAEVRAGRSQLESYDLESLADCQLLLEKIFIAGGQATDESLFSDLEMQAQQFCVGAKSSPDEELQSESQSCETLSDPEKELWESYGQRPEFFYAFECNAANCDDLRSRIVSVGDILIERAHAGHALFVFAAELDQHLIEQIVDDKVRLLQKSLFSLRSLGHLWSGLWEEQPRAASAASISKQDNSISASQIPVEFSPAQSLAEMSAVEHQSPAAHAEVSTASQQPAELSAASQQPAELGADIDREMVADFLQNGDELLERLTQSMLVLENNPNDSSSIEEIFRAAHTIKGTAGMLGLSCIEQLCHALESTFDRIRKKQIMISSGLTDTLLVGWDIVRHLFDLLRAGKQPVVNIDDYLNRLRAAERGEQIQPDKQKIFTQNESIGKSTAPADTSAKIESHKSEAVETIRVDLKRLDSLVNLVGELVIDRTRFARIEETMRLKGSSADLSHQMAESVLLFGRHMNEVQNIIMKVRMVPVGNAFYKFTRVVRDLSRQCGKEVELVIEGGETELDKTLVEELGDPLVHLIRNSIDHGIEEPEERIGAGKPRKGTIRLSAQQQGNMIVISVEDNGKGLDVEKIRAKAIKNGIIKENENIARKDIFNLIFEPGFSTAAKVTNISGRGVGMDVVRKNIQKLKGVVDLDSNIGEGTKITIKLPITLAIVPSLMVEVAGECFAVPLVNVIESIGISRDQIQQMGSAQFVKLRDEVIPLVRFADVLGLNHIDSNFWYRQPSVTPTLNRRRERLVFVVLGIGSERLGLVVDRLAGQQEIVIKPLGNLLGNQSGFAGGCVLGDGRVALVIDVADIMGVDAIQRGAHARRAAQTT